MIEPQQVQDGRVKVVDRRNVLDRLVPEFVGGTVREGRFTPAPASQQVKPHGL